MADIRPDDVLWRAGGFPEPCLSLFINFPARGAQSSVAGFSVASDKGRNRTLFASGAGTNSMSLSDSSRPSPFRRIAPVQTLCPRRPGDAHEEHYLSYVYTQHKTAPGPPSLVDPGLDSTLGPGLSSL